MASSLGFTFYTLSKIHGNSFVSPSRKVTGFRCWPWSSPPTHLGCKRSETPDHGYTAVGHPRAEGAGRSQGMTVQQNQLLEQLPHL